MKKITWKHTDLEVSPLAFGAMRFMGARDDPKDPERIRHAEEMVETCLECGINLFDHADIYGRGNCEAVFGEVLKRHPDWREKIVLQSKCGIRIGDLHRYDQSADYIDASVDAILQRLGVDCLDVLLIHRPDPLLHPGTVATTFDRLRRAGKVRYFGVSNFSVAQIQLLQSACDTPLVANQIQLSLIHPWSISEGLFVNRTERVFTGAEGVVDFCHREGIQLQAWSPVAGGLLSKPSESDDERTKSVRNAVAEVAAETGFSPEGVALAWILRHPAGIVPVIGTMKADRVRQCVPATEAAMDSDAWWRLLNASLGRRLP